MGMVHRMVVESCSDYFVQMRRRVYQTPRSFLSFLGSYKVGVPTTACPPSPIVHRVDVLYIVQLLVYHVGPRPTNYSPQKIERTRIPAHQERCS